jgi:hypothetical protein
MARPRVKEQAAAGEAGGRRRVRDEARRLAVIAGQEVIGDRTRVAMAALTLAVVLVAFWHWGAQAAIFLGLLAASVCGLLDGRVSVVAGLLGIAACPLLLIADQQAWLQRSTLVNYYAAGAGLVTLNGAADQMAIWAYYFLCIAVLAQIVRYAAREKRRDSEREAT